MTKIHMHGDVLAFKNTLFNVDKKHELNQYIGRLCYKRFVGKDPAWGIEVEVNGELVLVNRAIGEEYIEENIIMHHPGDKPKLFKVGHLQKAWDYDENNVYSPNCIKMRIYEVNIENAFGLPASLSSIVFI